MARVNKLYEKPLITSIALTDRVTVGQLVNGEYKVKTMLYSDFLAQIVDDTLVLVVTRAQLQALITASSLAIGVRYIITNAVGSTLSLLVQAVAVNILDEIAVNTADGENYKYNIVADTAILISNPIALGTSNQVLGVNNGATAQEYKTVQGTTNRVSVNHTANTITVTTPQDIATTSDVEFSKLKLNNIIPLEDEFLIIGQALNDSIGTVDNAYFISSLDLLTNAVADSTYLTTIEGIAAGGELEGNYASPTLKNSSVIGKVLTGLSVTGSAVVSTDSVLAAIGKLQNQVNGLAGGVEYQGTWNASTNTPTLTSSVGTQGFYYVVSVAGATNLNGITTWELGDWAIFNGSTWQKVDNTDAVVSVNGYTGIVTLSAADVSAVPTSSISGTSGTVALFGASNTLGNSILKQDSGNLLLNNGSRYFLLDTDNTGDGFLALQAGAGSSAFGGSVLMYSNAHATKAGYVDISTSAVAGAKIRFTANGLGGGSELLSINRNGQIITASATDTGEHFIIGGSARVNGTLLVTSNLDINGTTLNLGNNTIVDSYTGNSSTYRVLVLTNQTANTNIGLNYNPVANAGGGFNGTGQIFIAHNKGILASNAAGDNYIGVLRPIGTGVYFGGSLSSGELAGDGLFIATTGAATFSSSVTLGNKTTTEINALTPATGMTVFNTTLSTLCFYDGSGWRKVSHSAM